MEKLRDYKIYKYTNVINGKVYIGKTCQTLSERAGKEGKGYMKCTLFWRAIKKYGWNNFKGEFIEEGLLAEEAVKKETYYIEKYDSTNTTKGYNIREKDNDVWSEEIRNKLREKNRQRKVSKETIEKIRLANLGRKDSEETKKKKSAALRGRKVSKETREKLRKAKLGGKTSEEAKKKQSLAKIGKYAGEKSYWWGKHRSEETKNKIRESHTGMKVKEDVKNKISNTLKGRTPWNKGIKLSEETRNKMKESRQGKLPYNSKRIICIETGVEYCSISKAAELTGIRLGSISYALNKGIKYSAGGYHWDFLEKKDN